jgi:exodeoxyribonuclease VII small subunit
MPGPPDAADAGSGDGPLPFEAALERLERVVERLEGGNLPLEEALRAFEEGVALSRACAAQIEDAELRVEQLVRVGDGFAVRPFEAAEGDG